MPTGPKGKKRPANSIEAWTTVKPASAKRTRRTAKSTRRTFPIRIWPVTPWSVATTWTFSGNCPTNALT